MERNVHGTKSPPMVRNVYGTKSLVPLLHQQSALVVVIPSVAGYERVASVHHLVIQPRTTLDYQLVVVIQI